jgi:hydroxyacylglutathione hydrolase
MIQVERIPGKKFTSNIYLLTHSLFPTEAYVIDAGCTNGFLNTLDKLIVKGIFITHAHYDHIYDLELISNAYPEAIVFCSDFANQGLRSSKMNLSFYHENPVEYQNENVIILSDSDRLSIFEGYHMDVLETPGHNPGCLSFRIENYFFTGDSYLPEFKTVTKLKGGDKDANKESLVRIQSLLSPEVIVCPGHGIMKSLSWEDITAITENG